MLNSKIKKAQNIIKKYQKAAIAFSGGVDSLYLLILGLETLGRDNILAVTVKSPFSTENELHRAQELTKKLSVRHFILELDELSIHDITKNSIDRCYYCKSFRYQKLLKFAKEKKFDVILDGTNYSDLGDFRPGMRACRELGIISPLKEAGITKEEVRVLLKKAGIQHWNTPSRACLASRIPYNDKITLEKLRKIDLAEQFLMDCGFNDLRVRLHGDIARIEISTHQFEIILNNNLYKRIVEKFKEIGFRFITLDLEGIRSGSLNPKK